MFSWQDRDRRAAPPPLHLCVDRWIDAAEWPLGVHLALGPGQGSEFKGEIVP
jgi:hypothetical protein